MFVALALVVAAPSACFFFFFNDTATTEIYTLSLHDALPICIHKRRLDGAVMLRRPAHVAAAVFDHDLHVGPLIQAVTHVAGDRKSTRLNSSHQIISYAVFCLKKKKSVDDVP